MIGLVVVYCSKKVGRYSGGRFDLVTLLYGQEIFFENAEWLGKDVAHCGRFHTAACRSSVG